jgi:UDP-N-acetylmuramate: L-alanyl-gamma-D-glutamyl-meso-diaminopimelate ligase
MPQMTSLPDHIHFVGACGRAMCGVMAAVAALGVRVTGSDHAHAYGSSRAWLAEKGISTSAGFNENNFEVRPDLVVISRGHGRGNPEVEYVLEKRIPYLSLPEFLCSYFLNGSRNILITGSKGKTTTSAMLTEILENAGMSPGYMIGGMPRSGADPVRLGQDCYVIEADDYSTLWWNDNPKSVYYRPEVVVVCNVFNDHPEFHGTKEAGLRHFTALIDQIPQSGLLVLADCKKSIGLDRLVEAARCPIKTVDTLDGSGEEILGYRQIENGTTFEWNGTGFLLQMNGYMNARNAVSAAIAAQHLGVGPALSAAALAGFAGVSGRLDHVLRTSGLDVYVDCYGYLPESLAENLSAIREIHPQRRLVLVYQLIIVDGIPEAQEPLQICLANCDKVLIANYKPSEILVAASDDYLDDLVARLRNRGVDADRLRRLEEGLEVISDQLEAGDVLFFSVHPKSADQVIQIARQLDRS